MKVDRDIIHQKFGGHCAYCGTPLPSSAGKHMHIEHIKPVKRDYITGVMEKPENDCEENMFPACPKCNIYKSGDTLESFRTFVKETERKLKRLTLYNNAVRFGMIEFKEWDGVFYFEKFNKQ